MKVWTILQSWDYGSQHTCPCGNDEIELDGYSDRESALQEISRRKDGEYFGALDSLTLVEVTFNGQSPSGDGTAFGARQTNTAGSSPACPI